MWKYSHDTFFSPELVIRWLTQNPFAEPISVTYNGFNYVLFYKYKLKSKNKT